MAFPYKYFARIFGENGDNTLVPDNNPGDGNVSYETGFGADYSKDPENVGDPGKRIDRGNYNSISGQLCQTLKQYQEVGVPAFIDSVTNGGVAFPYTQGARCYYPTDGTPSKIYESLINGNIVLPGTDSAQWKDLGENPLFNEITEPATASPGARTLEYADVTVDVTLPFDPSITTNPVGGGNAMCFDSEGNLWMANRIDSLISPQDVMVNKYLFDGVRFLQTNISFSLSDFGPNSITIFGMALDLNGDMWITNGATNGNTKKYTFSAGTFSYSGIEIITSSGNNSGIAIDIEGNLWVGGPGGTTISKWNWNGTTFIVDGASFATTGAIAFNVDANGDIWTAAGITGQMTKYNFVAGNFVAAGGTFDFDPTTFLNGQSITGIVRGFCTGPDGNIYMRDTINAQRFEWVHKIYYKGTNINQAGLGDLVALDDNLEAPDDTIISISEVVDADNVYTGTIFSDGIIPGDSSTRITSDGDHVTLSNAGELVLRRPLSVREYPILKDPEISITTSTAGLSVLDRKYANCPAGLYVLDFSYNWSLDATNSDFVAELEINGILQGTSDQIHHEEPKESAGNDGDGRGTAQKQVFANAYAFELIDAGEIRVIFTIQPNAGGVEAAAWSILGQLKQVKNDTL